MANTSSWTRQAWDAALPIYDQILDHPFIKELAAGALAPDKYDGLIITHGSDTLSYSSAFLGLCLCGLDIPVALTAADLVPDDPRSNAVENLRACVEVIEKFRRGVFTVYKNPRDIPIAGIFVLHSNN